jgi:hypothetical protein
MKRTGSLRAAGKMNMKWLVSVGLLVSILFLPIGGVRGSSSTHESHSNISQTQVHREYKATRGSVKPTTILVQGPSPDTPDEPLTQVAEPQDEMPSLLVVIVVLVVLGTALLLAVSLLRVKPDN